MQHPYNGAPHQNSNFNGAVPAGSQGAQYPQQGYDHQHQQYNSAQQLHQSTYPPNQQQQQQQYMSPQGGYPSHPEGNNYHSIPSGNQYQQPQPTQFAPGPQQLQPQGQMLPPQPATANGIAPPPAAAMGTDDHGLRWTWSTFPSTVKPKQSTLASYVPSNLIGKGGGSSGDNHHIPVTDEMVVPLAAMFSPLYPSASIVRTGSAPQACRQCGAYLSVAAQVDFTSHYWSCPACLSRNSLPQGFSQKDPSLASNTVEYNCGVPDPKARQVFIFVIDTAIEMDELDALRKQLLRTIDLIPHDALICCVTFGRGVTVWDLGCDALNRCYTIRGNRAFTKESVLGSAGNVLNAALGGAPTSPLGNTTKADLSTSAGYIRAMLSVHRDNPVTGRFFVPLEECEFALSSIIEEMSVDPFPVPTGLRSERATGTALDVGATLLENLVAEGVAASAKILMFVGGPATRGPGAVVGLHKKQMMRSHRDFHDYNVPMYEKAYEFYNEVERRLSSVSATLDCFVASFDQVGIMELRECVNRTGGVFVCGDTFIHEMFEISLQRYFLERDFTGKRAAASLAAATNNLDGPMDGTPAQQFAAATSGFNATFDIFTSRDTLVSGAIGPCRAYIVPSANTTSAFNSSGSASPSGSPTAATLTALVGSSTRAHIPPILEPAKRVSPIAIGEGNTQRWVSSSVDSGVTITFLFDTAVLEAPQAAPTPGPARNRFVQFVTHYSTPNGERRTRVTTAVHHISPTTNPGYFSSSPVFDQTCAATVVSRMAVSMLEDYSPHMWETSKRWVDKLLVKFVKRFGTYNIGSPDSLRLSPTLSLFPSFMYNLRRSEYFMIMNISPDETVFKRHWLMREGCDRVVLMIQPTLHSYTFQAPYATPVPLDSNSIQLDNILVIDCFFNVHIIWGKTIEEWIKMKYHLNPEYAHFKDLLEAPDADVQITLAERFPYPRFSRSDIDGGEARHLKTRLNPSTTYANAAPNGHQPQGSVLNTDDASIAKFMQTLKEAVVRPDDGKSANLS